MGGCVCGCEGYFCVFECYRGNVHTDGFKVTSRVVPSSTVRALVLLSHSAAPSSCVPLKVAPVLEDSAGHPVTQSTLGP